MESPLLSILIATRNRQETASVVISEILKLNLPDLELVVSDTSDEQNLLSMVGLITNTDNENFKYAHTPIALSMTDNYSKAIDMASGEYICMIGDDDFILPNVIEVAAFAKKNNLQSITQNITCNFNWGEDGQGTLYGSGTKLKEILIKKTKNAMRWVLLKGGMMTNDAPRFYHGIVKRSLFEKLKKRAGRYFFGTSPDMSATISICCLSDIYGYSLDQFTVPGASAKSNSNLGLKKLAPHIDSNSHVALHLDEAWPEIIPPLFCAETGWPEATYKTLKTLNEDKVKDLNLSYCYLLMYIKYKSQHEYITCGLKKYLKRLSIGQFLVMPLKLTLIVLVILLNKIHSKLTKNFFSVRASSSISDISSKLKFKNTHNSL